MITYKTVLTALADGLTGAFGHPVYLDYCPQDFTRPCFLVEGMKFARDSENRHTVVEAMTLTITCFGQVDSQGDSDQLELLGLLEGVDRLFRPGFFPVEGRAIRCEAAAGGSAFGQAWVELSFQWEEARGEGPALPAMEAIHTQTKI